MPEISGNPKKFAHIALWDGTPLADLKEDIPMKTHALTGLRPTQKETLEALQERIRIRAYQLYEQRGRQDGHELDDWVQAEREVATIEGARRHRVQGYAA